MPVHALQIGAARVAMVVAQLSDRMFTRALNGPVKGLWAQLGGRGLRHRHLVWRGNDGRLLLLDRRHDTGTDDGSAGHKRTHTGVDAAAQDAPVSKTWCAVSEAALVHLQQHKFKHFGSMPPYDARGFVFERERGIRPMNSLNSSGPDDALRSLLATPLMESPIAGSCAMWKVSSTTDRSMF